MQKSSKSSFSGYRELGASAVEVAINAAFGVVKDAVNKALGLALI
jgi:hypothetical protein